MANTQNYINHLLQNTGITPACSEEERLAAEDIAQIFRNHGFDPEVQEFNAPAPSRLAFAVTGILAFAGALLMGIGGGIGLVGTLLAIVGAVLYVLERTGHPVVSRLGKTGVSQNVIAYHKASGPLASPRNRPVVVVAHYDSPRAELLAREPYASYRALIAKLLPVATVAPAAVAILRILPLPGALKVLLWIVAILASLVALANAANIISNRFVLPYTSGAVCNKSSVAAMLGVMDNVAPFQGENEFPDDVPFDTYFGEQKRRAEEMAQQADVEFFEIDPCVEHLIGFALHDLGDLPPQQHRGDKSRHQNNGHDNGHNLHDFFHFLSVLKTKTVVPASSNPILR